MNVDDTIPFGGKTILFGGDFRQILPVVRHGREADVIASSLKHSILWSHVQVLHLTTNMRATLNPSQNNTDARTFQSFLLSIGDGREPTHPHVGPCMIKLPSNICIDPEQDGINALISAVFPDLNNIDYERAILCATNEDVDDINKIIQSNAQNTTTQLSADTLADPSQYYIYPTEFLNSLTPAGLPPHKLSLQKNTPVLLLRNLDPKNGLLNGTRLQIITLSQRVLEAEIMTGKNTGKHVFIPRISMIPSDSGLPFDFKRRQFPVKPAYAITINKSQGQTLSFVGINLSRPVFSHGQLYVALSRTTALDNLRILSNTTSSDGNQ